MAGGGRLGEAGDVGLVNDVASAYVAGAGVAQVKWRSGKKLFNYTRY